MIGFMQYEPLMPRRFVSSVAKGMVMSVYLGVKQSVNNAEDRKRECPCISKSI